MDECKPLPEECDAAPEHVAAVVCVPVAAGGAARPRPRR